MRLLFIAALLFVALPAQAGTLLIEQWQSVGTAENSNVPIYRGLVDVDSDATTSTSNETVTMDGRARYISVLAVSGDHRVSVGSSSASTLYFYVKEGERRDISLPSSLSVTVAYRTDS